MIPKKHIVPIQVEFILVFIPIEKCRSGMKFIIVSCKLKTNFVPDLESQIMWSVESEACISKLLRKLREQEHLRLSNSRRF